MKPSVLLCLACVACQSRPEPVDYGFYASEFYINGLPTASEEFNAGANNSISEGDKFYVAVEVVLHAEQAAKYPVTHEALQMALDEWAKHLPIRLTVYIEDSTPPVPMQPFMWFGTPDYINRYGVVEILMDDIQGAPYNRSLGILGLWLPDAKQILLDADTLEANPDMAYSVTLHELGHMFGLPHLVGFTEPAYTGTLVVPIAEDAESYVMYPTNIPGKLQQTLSQLEIDLARHYVLHSWSNGLKIADCLLTSKSTEGIIFKEDPHND